MNGELGEFEESSAGSLRMDEMSQFEDFEIKTHLFVQPINSWINNDYLPRLWRLNEDHIEFNF